MSRLMDRIKGALQGASHAQEPEHGPGDAHVQAHEHAAPDAAEHTHAADDEHEKHGHKHC